MLLGLENPLAKQLLGGAIADGATVKVDTTGPADDLGSTLTID